MSGQDMIRQLTAELEAANERAKVAEAEVAGWRRAGRWVEWASIDSWSMQVGPIIIGTARPSTVRDGWTAEVQGQATYHGLPDRNTACAKVCELLGIPTVLPGGE